VLALDLFHYKTFASWLAQIRINYTLHFPPVVNFTSLQRISPN
jgi:hypothetical protein